MKSSDLRTVCYRLVQIQQDDFLSRNHGPQNEHLRFEIGHAARREVDDGGNLSADQ